MKKRAKKVSDLNCEWKDGNIISSVQKDGSSCGPFVLMVTSVCLDFTFQRKTDGNSKPFLAHSIYT